jgi:hypothetical protein
MALPLWSNGGFGVSGSLNAACMPSSILRHRRKQGRLSGEGAYEGSWAVGVCTRRQRGWVSGCMPGGGCGHSTWWLFPDSHAKHGQQLWGARLSKRLVPLHLAVWQGR